MQAMGNCAFFRLSTLSLRIKKVTSARVSNGKEKKPEEKGSEAAFNLNMRDKMSYKHPTNVCL